MSVDTYLKGKNVAPYQKVGLDGLEVLVAPSLIQWAQRIDIELKRFLFWRSFDVIVEHRHAPT